jgi:hypothetical protein
LCYSGADLSNGNKSFWRRLWEDELSEFALHWLGDMVKAALVLLGLGLFFGFIKLLERIGYDPADLRYLEKVHFWGALTAIVLLMILFIGKGIFGRK